MKALILAGGRGKRLGELTQSKNKCILEIHGRPLVTYSLDCASQMDASEIVIVVGYQADELMKIVGNEYKGKPVRYVFQKEQKGLVHAIECAKDSIGKENFFLFLGDELMVNPKHKEMACFIQQEKPFVSCGMIKVQDPNLISKTYAIKEENGSIVDLIEKPDAGVLKSGTVRADLMGTGNCFFNNEIFSYIPRTPINPKRGERELPDLIKAAVLDHQKVKSYLICDEYYNVNVKEEIRDAESFFTHFSEGEDHAL
jgi:dTDP-glucose pyrophosphorylase